MQDFWQALFTNEGEITLYRNRTVNRLLNEQEQGSIMRAVLQAL